MPRRSALSANEKTSLLAFPDTKEELILFRDFARKRRSA
jgi:hypothetical protein